MIKDTANAFLKSNPVIPANELAFESDTGIFKIGDGATPYNALPIAGQDVASVAGDVSAIEDEIDALTDGGSITGIKVVTTTEYAAIEDAATDGILYLVTADPEA